MANKELTDTVILAITNAERKGINLPPLDHIDQMLLNDADYIRPQAQAAIAAVLEAISEPTEAMRLAAAWEMDNPRPVGSEVRMNAIIRAAIAASPLGNGGNGNG